MTLMCEICGHQFPRAKTGAPARTCSKKCRSRAYYLAHGAKNRSRRPQRTEEEKKQRKRAYDIAYRPRYYATHRLQLLRYGWEYNQRPEVKARQRDRMRHRWWTDSEYRARQLERLRNYVRRKRVWPEIPMPYTGHRWLDMAREVVGYVDPRSPRADYYWDQMGEALLALLEGGNPREAVIAYRKREYIPQHMTRSLNEWKSDPEEEMRWFDRHMPSHLSAEEEAIARETTTYYLKTPYHHGRNGRPMRNRQQQPSQRRRRRDAGWRKYEA